MVDSTPRDWADAHVERWRHHWVMPDAFDDDTEAIFVRMSRIVRQLRAAKSQAAQSAQMAESEYDTLHMLLIRETPGIASPTELATDTGLSAAGITARLDALEAKAWVRRSASAEDRRRIEVHITDEGLAKWREVAGLRGKAEDELTSLLSQAERAELAHLLKRMTLWIEQPPSESARSTPQPDAPTA